MCNSKSKTKPNIETKLDGEHTMQRSTQMSVMGNNEIQFGCILGKIKNMQRPIRILLRSNKKNATTKCVWTNNQTYPDVKCKYISAASTLNFYQSKTTKMQGGARQLSTKFPG